MALSAADEAKMKRIILHAVQVQDGLIPTDSPPDFVRPEGEDALVDGLPWWFGPDYKPTPEAIAEFSKPFGSELLTSRILRAPSTSTLSVAGMGVRWIARHVCKPSCGNI